MPQDRTSDFLAQDATNLVRQKATEYGVDPDFAERILSKETRKRADIIAGRVRSPKGATGAMQLMPATAARLGVQDSTDYVQNIDGGVRELARLQKQYNGDQALVAAGYNAGEGAVKKYGGVPAYKETQDYVKEVAQNRTDQFLKGQTVAPASTPQSQPVKGPQKKAPAINPFDWQTGGGVKVSLKKEARFQGLREMTGNEDGQAPPPVDPQQRARDTVTRQGKLERGASQLYNAAAKGVVRIPQGLAELSDLTGKYLPVARLGNELQRLITGEQPQPLAPAIAPYTQAVERAIDKDVPVDPADQSWVTAKIPRAVGSLAPFVLGGAASGGSRVATGLLGAAGNTADIATEFDQAGGDPANRDKALALAAATGLSEVFGVGKILAKFGANRGLMQTAKNVLEEGGQEAFQQWANNLNASSVGAYEPWRPQMQGVGEAAALGGLIGGGLGGVSNLAGRQAAPTQTAGRAPALPLAAPRTIDTNLNPDEVLTPATGAAQPVIDPVTGIPTPEASNPAADAQMNDIFAQLLGRKPDKAAEKSQAAARDVQTALALADEAAAAGDVDTEVAALKTALKRKPDVKTEVQLQARLASLEPAAATRKLAGQRAPVEPTLPEFPILPGRASETAPLVDAVVDAPTADLPQIDPGHEILMNYGERRKQAEAAKNYALAESTAAGELAALQARGKQIDPSDLAGIAQHASAVRALQLEIKRFQKAQAEEAKASTPAKVATPKVPKTPKVVAPRAEGVRRRQGVLKGISPDQTALIDNPAAIENRQGGIPPVEPVGKNVLPFEQLAAQEKTKVNKRANMSPVEYLKQASNGEGFRVLDKGEAEGVSAKNAKIVAFTNQDSQYGMNDAAVMLDEGGYFMPDGRRFTDEDVKEADVLDYLKDYGKQASAGNTGGIDPRIADAEAAYIAQKEAEKGYYATKTAEESTDRMQTPVGISLLPEYAQGAVWAAHRADKPGIAESQWVKETVPVESLKPGNEMLWGGGRFVPRKSVTEGPIVLAADGEVVDGNNRLHEAIRRGDQTIDIFREVQSSGTGKTSTPSWMLGEPRRPQPIETPRNQVDVRQQALAKVGASDLPEVLKQRLRTRISEADETYAQSVLNDNSDIQVVSRRQPVEQIQEVELRKTGTDSVPVVEMPKRAMTQGTIRFTTSQGSEYTFKNGKTQRNKSYHNQHDPTDIGLKPMSDQTFFSNQNAARALGLWQTSSANKKRAYVKDDEIWLLSWNEQRNQYGIDEKLPILSREPQIGLHPIELFEQGKDRLFRGTHPGNAINEIRGAVKIQDSAAMPKRATPANPIPDDLKRVYGEKITSEQAEAIQRRRAGQNKEIGSFGHLSSFARKQAEGQRYPLAGHPQLRELLDLPPMPVGKAESQAAWQHTLDALAELAPASMTRSSEMGLDGLRAVYGKLKEIGNQRGIRISSDLEQTFQKTAWRFDNEFETPYKKLEKDADYHAAMEAAAQAFANGRQPKQTEVSEIKQTVAKVASKYGFKENFINKRLWPEIRDRAKAGESDWSKFEEKEMGGDQGDVPASRVKSASPAESTSGRAPAPAQEGTGIQTPNQAEIADRLARLRAAIQTVPSIGAESAKITQPPTSLPDNPHVARLRAIAERVNAAFRAEVPETPAAAAKTEIAKTPQRAKPPVRTKTVTVTDARNEIGASAETDASKLRLGGPAENYREIYVQVPQAEGQPFVNKPHYGKLENVAFDYRLEDRTTTRGERATLLLEGQSDWAQAKDRKDAPYRNNWLKEVFSRTVAAAKTQGQDGVLFLQTPGQVAKVQRWGKLTEKDGKYYAATIVPEVTPIIRRYVKELPELARKEAARLGVELQTREVQTDNGTETLLYLPLKPSDVIEIPQPVSKRAPSLQAGPTPLRMQTEQVEPRVGGYIRREGNGRIYEIVKYDPRESQVRIKQPGSPMEVVIPQSEARRSVIPDDVAKTEIGEAQNERQPSQDIPETTVRQEAPEIKDSPSEIGEGVRRAAEEAKRKLRKPEARRGERGAIANPFAKSPKPEITKRDLKNKSGGRYAEVRLGEQEYQVETADAKGAILHSTDTAIIREAQQQFAQEAFKALGDIAANTATRQEVRDQATSLGRQLRDAVNRGDWTVASRLNKKLQGIKGATTFDVQEFMKQAKSALNSKVIKPDTEKAILAAAQEVANGIKAGDQKAVESGRLKLLEIRDDLKAEVNLKPTEKSVTDKIATVHSITQLLAPLTAMRNILSNAAYAVGRSFDVAVAAVIDKGISKVTGERTVVAPRRGQIADLKAEMRRAYGEIKKGNLNVMRESQFGLADHHVLESKVGKFFEKALSVSLKVPDAGFFHAAYNESVRNQIAAQNKSIRPTQSLEQIHERAVNEALQSVFADSNALSRAAVWTKDKINLGKAWGVADVMGLRYPKVPANLLARALEHSPAGLIRELYNLSQVGQGKRDFDQRTTSINIAKSLTGTLGAATAGYLLTALGIILREPNPDDSYGEQALQASTGLPRYGINLSAAKRYATGDIVDLLTKGDNSAGKLLRGDLTADFGWLQPHGMMLGIGSALFDERSQKQNGNALESVIGGLDAATETLSDQSILKLGRDFMRDATREGGGVGKAVGNLAYKGVVNLPASFTPGALNSLRPLFDNTWRDTRPEQPGKTIEQKGRAMAGEAINRVMSRVPVLSQRLPVRPDVTGEPRKAPQDKFANPQALLNPAKLSEYQPNDYTDALVRLGLGASYTPRFISKTDAMPEPTSRLREREIERGRAEMERGNRLVNSDSFKKADPEKQKEMIRTMRAKVTENLSGRRKSSGYPFVDAQSKEGKRAVTGGR